MVNMVKKFQTEGVGEVMQRPREIPATSHQKLTDVQCTLNRKMDDLPE